MGILFGANKREVERLAFYDSLTKLPNLLKMREDFEHLPDGGQGYAYLIVSVDKYRKIRNVFGGPMAKTLLCSVADTLSGLIEEGELLARMEGRYFVLLLRRTDLSQLSERTEHILQKLSEIDLTDGNAEFAYGSTYAVGIYLVSGDESSFEEIGDRAYIALLTAWEKKPSYAFFVDGTEHGESGRKKLMDEIDHGFDAHEFVPYFQPIYDLSTGAISGAEVLARWQHPERGILKPRDFTNQMEFSGKIFALDLLMLEEACKMVQRWMQSELMPVPISVNISLLTIYQIGFVEQALQITKKYDVPPVLIKFEMPEQAMFETADRMLDVMNRLHEPGFKICVDEFGSSHASFATIGRMPVDGLKLQLDFVADAERAPQRLKIVLSNILRMAKELDIHAVCDHIENKMQEELVRGTGAQFVQGPLYGVPMPAADFEALIF